MRLVTPSSPPPEDRHLNLQLIVSREGAETGGVPLRGKQACGAQMTDLIRAPHACLPFTAETVAGSFSQARVSSAGTGFQLSLSSHFLSRVKKSVERERRALPIQNRSPFTLLRTKSHSATICLGVYNALTLTELADLPS